MKMIISPTKQMKANQDSFQEESQPIFFKETQQLLECLQRLSFSDAKKIWKCSEKLAKKSYEQLQSTSLTKRTSPAIMTYKGLQYQYMAPDILTRPALDYLKDHVRILSGFYGILRPFDGIIPYRLEMKTDLSIGDASNLYAFWGKKIYDELTLSNEPIVNLASIEYAKAVTPYLKESDYFVDIHFNHLVNGKLKVKPTLAKMARGEMIRFMAEKQIKTIDGIKEFDHPHYQFSKKDSTNSLFVFIYQD